MNRDDIIRMAQEACETTNWKPGLGNEHVVEFMVRFAALVAAAEREACAAVCEEHWHIDGEHTAYEFARVIRAMGEEK